MYNSNFSKFYFFISKIKFSFQFVPFICRFLKSETTLNFSYFNRQDFEIMQIFDGYDVIMT